MSINKSILTVFQRHSAISNLLCKNYGSVFVNIESMFHNHAKFSIKAAPIHKQDWNKAVSEAEKIVGYPTSFLSLRWLLSDETANVALHLRKLVGSNHPLLKTAKSLIYNGRNNMQAWGLIVLLISKTAGQVNIDDIQNKSAGVLQSQRILAEVTEMIRTSYLIHKSLVNIQKGVYPEASEMEDISFGNKITLLSGDYLLGNSSAELAALRNQDLVELMSSAVRDLSEAEFIGRRDSQNNPLPSVPPEDRTNYAVNEWTLSNILSAGSLLGKACKGTLKLAGHDEAVQDQGYNFGKHLALAWQACLDLIPFSTKDRTTPFSICSAPVMFHIEHDPSILIEINKGLDLVHNIDYAKVFDIVISGPGIELTKQLQRQHLQCAMELLNIFQENDARKALCNIIAAMEDF